MTLLNLGAMMLAAMLTAVASAHRHDQQLGDKRAEVDANIQLMQSEPWEKRAAGFYQMIRVAGTRDLNGASTKIAPALQTLQRDLPDRADNIRGALIGLLRRESAFSKTAETTTDEFSSYYGDVILAVSSLRDKRALSALLEVIEAGNLATRGVAGLGANTTLASLLALATSPSDLKRNAAIRTIGYLLDPAIDPELVTPVQVSDIKNALVRATTDYNPYIRISAVESVSRLLEPDVIRLLQSVAESDPYAITMESGRIGFPVREAAKRALLSKGIPRDLQPLVKY